MKSIIRQYETDSLIRQSEMLRPERKVSVLRSLASSPILTPLVDVFAILVIYLLIHSVTPNSITEFDKDMKLPHAVNGKSIDPGFVVQIKNHGLFIDDKRVSKNQLIEKLQAYSDNNKTKGEKSRLTIMTDQGTPFSDLSPLVEECSLNGIEEVQFAVIRSPQS